MEVHYENVGVTMVCPGIVYSNILNNALRENLQVCEQCNLHSFCFRRVKFSLSYPKGVQDLNVIDVGESSVKRSWKFMEKGPFEAGMKFAVRLLSSFVQGPNVTVAHWRTTCGM